MGRLRHPARMAAGGAPRSVRYPRALALAAVAYAVLHHLGSLPGGLGEVGLARWADWLDLAVPVLVLGSSALALVAAGVSRRIWLAAALGGLLYAQGHGIHLAANSIGNVDRSDVAHLWDEVVGHLLWYAGVAVLLGCHAVVMAGRPRSERVAPGAAVASVALALGVGLTWWTNAVGGGTTWFALPVALGLAWFGLRHRGTLAVLLPVGFVPAAALLALSAVTGRP